MTDMLDLWIPTLLSAVAVFVASSVIHMISGFHKNDYPAPPNQDALPASPTKIPARQDPSGCSIQTRCPS